MITGEDSTLIRNIGVRSLILSMLIPDIILLLFVCIKMKKRLKK